MDAAKKVLLAGSPPSSLRPATAHKIMSLCTPAQMPSTEQRMTQLDAELLQRMFRR